MFPFDGGLGSLVGLGNPPPNPFSMLPSGPGPVPGDPNFMSALLQHLQGIGALGANDSTVPQDPNEDNFARLSKFLGGLNPLQGNSSQQLFNPLQSMGGNDDPEGNGNNNPQQSPTLPPPSDPMLGFQPGATIPQNPQLMSPFTPAPPTIGTGGMQPLNPQLLNMLTQIFSQSPGQMNMPPLGTPPPMPENNQKPNKNPHQNQPPKSGGY